MYVLDSINWPYSYSFDIRIWNWKNMGYPDIWKMLIHWKLYSLVAIFTLLPSLSHSSPPTPCVRCTFPERLSEFWDTHYTGASDVIRSWRTFRFRFRWFFSPRFIWFWLLAFFLVRLVIGIKWGTKHHLQSGQFTTSFSNEYSWQVNMLTSGRISIREAATQTLKYILYVVRITIGTLMNSFALRLFCVQDVKWQQT